MTVRGRAASPGIAAGVVLLLAGTWGLAATEPAVTASGGSEAAGAFRLARIPYSGARGLYKDAQGFLEALARRLRAGKASLVLAPDYEGAVDRLRAGEADAAWLGTLAYAQARARGVELTPLVCPVRRTGRTYTGLVITHRDARIYSLADLRGRRFGFVDHDSASGYLFPRLMLEQAGVRVPAELKTLRPGEPDFLGNHANVVLNVLLRKVDAGAIYEGAAEEAVSNDPVRLAALRVLARTEPIPGEPIVVLASAPQELKDRIRGAFLALFQDHALKFEDVLGFAPVRDSDYDYVRRLVSRTSDGVR
ncbi:MAG: phosphate/phosphite/phosphonate ABC transporter substrate-binding protein [Candidatus Wallbacteria bacterium]|nr:phosphate/phosphite/phosphonate ABC transporter substrate-binding protein [Candidatus Wallbacteria bacterium]